MRLDIPNAIAANWPIKITALALAAVLWAGVSAEEPTTQLIPVRLDIQTPTTRTLTQDVPRVQALYGGSARELIKLYASPPYISKVIPDSLSESFFTIDLSPQDVTLASDAEVILQDIFPRRLVVALDEVSRRPVPVVPRVTITEDSGFIRMGPIAALPESILVIGPEAQVRRIGSVFTVPLELNNVREPVRQTVAIDTAAFGVVRLSQNEVEIQAQIEALSERIMTGIPVTFTGGGWESDPPTVQVSVSGPTSRLVGLTADSVAVTAPPADADGAMVPIRVRVPPGLSASVAPDSVQVQRIL